MKILFVVPYPKNCAPSQRLKFEQYFDYLEKNSWQVTFSSFMTRRLYTIINKPGYGLEKIFFTLFGYLRRLWTMVIALFQDVIYLHLEASPFGPPIFEYAFYLFGKPIIYDIDDLIYLPPPRKTNKFIELLRNRKKANSILTLSSQVIVCTRHLKEYAEKFNDNVTNISSTIDTDIYTPKESYGGKKSLVIGWSGSKTTSFYLHLLDRVLVQLQKMFAVKVKVIGDIDFSVNGLSLVAIPWRLETEIEDLLEIDIGLYPLDKNNWILGKSGLKALQYMALGIPVVAQKIGTNLEIIQDGLNGFLADSEEEWFEKISRLVLDADLIEKIGHSARKTVVERYSVSVNASKYLEIIKKA